jgi:hypothetical protein
MGLGQERDFRRSAQGNAESPWRDGIRMTRDPPLMKRMEIGVRVAQDEYYTLPAYLPSETDVCFLAVDAFFEEYRARRAVEGDWEPQGLQEFFFVEEIIGEPADFGDAYLKDAFFVVRFDTLQSAFLFRLMLPPKAFHRRAA